MKRFKKLGVVIGLSLAVLGSAGCTEESGVKQQTKVTGPEGSTVVTKEVKVEKSGQNPPTTPER